MRDDVKKGLLGIVVDETTSFTSNARHKLSLTYRGYAVQDLCDRV